MRRPRGGQDYRARRLERRRRRACRDAHWRALLASMRAPGEWRRPYDQASRVAYATARCPQCRATAGAFAVVGEDEIVVAPNPERLMAERAASAEAALARVILPRRRFLAWFRENR